MCFQRSIKIEVSESFVTTWAQLLLLQKKFVHVYCFCVLYGSRKHPHPHYRGSLEIPRRGRGGGVLDKYGCQYTLLISLKCVKNCHF